MSKLPDRELGRASFEACWFADRGGTSIPVFPRAFSPTTVFHPAFRPTPAQGLNRTCQLEGSSHLRSFLRAEAPSRHNVAATPFDEGGYRRPPPRQHSRTSVTASARRMGRTVRRRVHRCGHKNRKSLIELVF